MRRVLVLALLIAATVAQAQTPGFTAHWTPEHWNGRRGQCDSDTVFDPTPLAFLVAFTQQSPFYLAHRDSFLDNRTPYFAANWHTVVSEAAPHVLLVTSDSSAFIADTSHYHRFYVAERDLAMNVSCWSNAITAP